jgi:hypothetical protein
MIPAAVVGVATVVALASAWHSGGHVWRRLDDEQRAFAAYTPAQRRGAAISAIPLDPAVFDFYAQHLAPHDRIYFLTMPSGFGQFFTLPQIVAATGRFYLLPAVQLKKLSDATVVVTYDADPNNLPVHFITEAQAGQQAIYVARIRVP